MFGSSSRASSSRSAAAARPARRSATASSSRASPRRLLGLAASAACAATLLATGAAAGRAAGEFEVVQPNSMASAMMMALINDHDVVILDKVENNRDKLDDGRPVWGSILSLDDNSIRAIDVNSNTFCASGGHLGNGSLLVAGGNQAVQYGGASLAGGQDPTTGPYKDTDGSQALRIMEFTDTSANLAWNDGTQFMVSKRWYPGIETLADGSILLIGGATGGGYINRNYPNDSPPFQGGSLQNLNAGGANPTWEFFPSKGNAPAVSNFMSVTNGLSMYPHTFLMPSGLLFMQANVSTVLWDYTNNVETYLSDMPNNVVRVYPASGATAMMPLTPANNYTPTILFCGGAVLTNDQWGNYTAPNVNVLNIEASKDCSSITPETADGKQTGAGYVHEEDLPQGRTMGQFIHLPDGTMVIVNGANKGTAGYSNQTWTFTADGTRTEGMSADPTYQPVLYDPSKPQGQRLSSTGFALSNIARLYHSSAILVPDGSVLIGGSNPHQDVALTMPLNSSPRAFNTTYELEKWYPPYYFQARPVPTGLPSSIMFGGDTWTFKIDAAYMNADNAANYRAKSTKVRVIRPGFSTHAMNMGQRSLELAVAYTVNEDGSVDFEAMPMPQNKNIFVAGPALLFVVVDGVPSKGAYVQIGSTGFSGPIPTNYAVAASPTLRASTTQQANKFNGTPAKDSASSFGLGKIIGVAVGGAAVLAAILLGLCLWRRSANRKANGGGGKKGATRSAGAGVVAGGAMYGMGTYGSGHGGPEYKRVDTPNFTPGRASMGTFDSYRMNDVGGGSAPGTPGTPAMRYYDHPGAAQRAASPLVPGQRSPSGGSSQAGAGGAYQQQGWGEHQAAGDMGEEYYRDGGYSDPSRLYDAPHPPSSHQQLAAPQASPYGAQQPPQGYGSQPQGSPYAASHQQLAPQHAQSYSQQHDYFRGSNS